MKKIVLILLASISLTAFSQQSIVNIERSSPSTDSLTVINVDLLGNLIGGNNDLQLASASVGIGKHFGKNDLVRIIGGQSYIKSYDAILNNSFFAQLRHNHELSDHMRTFAFYQYQYNNVLLIDRRQIGGAGLRFNLLPDTNKFRVDVLLGVMYEEELLNQSTLMLNEKYHTQYLRGATSLHIKIDLTDNFSFHNTTYFQPYLMGPSDFRLLNDTDLMFGIGKGLDFLVSTEVRYDNQAPSSLFSTDYSITFGITYALEK